MYQKRASITGRGSKGGTVGAGCGYGYWNTTTSQGKVQAKPSSESMTLAPVSGQGELHLCVDTTRVTAFDMAYFTFQRSPISAVHREIETRKCPWPLVTEEAPCCCQWLHLLQNHFASFLGSYISPFLNSATVLCEDITTSHKPQNPTLWVTFWLPAALQTTLGLYPSTLARICYI